MVNQTIYLKIQGDDNNQEEGAPFSLTKANYEITGVLFKKKNENEQDVNFDVLGEQGNDEAIIKYVTDYLEENKENMTAGGGTKKRRKRRKKNKKRKTINRK